MSRLFLHIGMPKTGSTTIQATLAAHGELLARHRVIYPDMAVNHGNFLIPTFEPSGDLGAARRMRELLGERAEVLTQRLIDLVEKSRDKDFILSGENFSSMSEAGAARLLDFLKERFDDIEVLAFVRPPHSLVHSLTQEQIQNMGHGTDWLHRGRLLLPYKRALQKWVGMVGDALTVRIFSRSTLLNSCAVATVLDFAGLPVECYAGMKVISSNPTLSMFATELFCIANEMYPPRIDNNPNPARAKRLSVVLRRMTADGALPFLAPDAFVSRSLEASKGDVLWLERLMDKDLNEFDRLPPSDAPRFSLFADEPKIRDLSALVKALNDELLSAQGLTR